MTRTSIAWRIMIIILILIRSVRKAVNTKDLEIEIQKIVIPVVAGALGMIKKNTEDHIKRIPRNLGLQELQKIVLNGTAHLLRRVLCM